MPWVGAGESHPNRSMLLQAYFIADIAGLGEWMARHLEYSPEQKQLLAGAVADFKGIRKKERAAFVASVQACAAGQ